MFAIPGVGLGMAAAAAMNAGVRYILFSLVNNETDYMLTPSSIIIGTATGLLIPLVANYAPISVALGKNLRTSLDQSRRSANEMSIKVTQLSSMGLSLVQLMMAVLLIVFGVLCYYVAPVSALNHDSRTFYLILETLLICLILGLTFLSSLF